MPKPKPNPPHFELSLTDHGDRIELEIKRDREVTFAFTDDEAESVRIRKLPTPEEVASELTDKINRHKKRGDPRAGSMGPGYVWLYEGAVVAELAKLRRSMRRLEQLGMVLVTIAEISDSESKNHPTRKRPTP